MMSSPKRLRKARADEESVMHSPLNCQGVNWPAGLVQPCGRKNHHNISLTPVPVPYIVRHANKPGVKNGGRLGNRANRMTNRILLSIAILTLATGAAYAQTGAAQLQGTVTDASGAVVPNADVTLDNPQTGG